MGKVRVAQAQINVTVGDLRGNTKLIIDWVDTARSFGTDLVTFPELALCGYPPEDLLLKRSFTHDNLGALESMLPFCHGITVVVGFADEVIGPSINRLDLLLIRIEGSNNNHRDKACLRCRLQSLA